MWGCIQGQAQKENQLENQEACGLKPVLENGLQIEMGNSGSVNLHACVTLEQKPVKSFAIPEGDSFFYFFLLFLTSLSLSLTRCDYCFFFNQWLWCCQIFRARLFPAFVLVQSWHCAFPCYFKASSKMRPQWSLEDVDLSQISDQETSRFEGYHNPYPCSSWNVFSESVIHNFYWYEHLWMCWVI